jgi:tryptophan synthase alpha chain
MTIADKLKQLKADGRKALTPFSTVSDPDWDISLEIFRRFGEWGADFMELGIPYSDPLMDGPTLQASYTRTLKQGFRVPDLPKFVEQIREKSDTPMLVMTCFNPIFKYGVEPFFRDVSSAGVDSLLITDLPPEEWGEKTGLAKKYNLGTIFLVTPTTPPDRIKAIGKLSDPFVYCVSKAGVTGTGDNLPEELTSYVESIRGNVPYPVLIGFGISTPEHARVASSLADGVVIGSAIAKIIEKNLGNRDKIIPDIGAFITSVRRAMDE